MRKIDLYLKNFETGVFEYTRSTNKAKTCNEAKARFCETYKANPENVKAVFNKERNNK